MESECKLSNGFYVFDNMVHVFLQEMHLTELPHLKEPEISFPLAYNALSVEVELGKMIIETDYYMMRNTSDVLSAGEQDPYKNSPFVLQQVQDEGHLAIIAEGCFVSGFTIVRLTGFTVTLGHDTFGLRNCKFSIEISGEGSGSPPVIAPYFSKAQASILENILSKPIRKELIAKLRSAAFSFINTSFFEDELPKYRHEQEKIFKQASTYVNKYVHDTIKESIVNNKASYDFDPMKISWTVKEQGNTSEESVSLEDIVIDGFDTAYSPQIGGPYKLRTVGIADTLRYNTLKIHGKIIFERNDLKNEHGFYMELQDVTLNINIDLEDTSQSTFNTDSYFYWRNTDFSIINLEETSKRIVAESIISGYLINKVSNYLNNKIPKSSIGETGKSVEENDGEHEQDGDPENEQDGVKSMEASDVSAVEENVNINISINESEGKVDDEATLKDQNIDEITDKDSEKNKMKKDISLDVESVEEARRDIQIKPNLRKKKGFLSRNSNGKIKKHKDKHKKEKHFQENIKYGKIKKHKHKHHTDKKDKKYKKKGKKSSNTKRQNSHKISGLPISYDNEV
ncbi:hypothetical protein RR46_11359 [Papilio xuthus]|uniref:Uncharacterized protein n=1 Tax=Papilio xuthus TaxID=66420 RepID=A0A194PQC4_PAPXU|nr:hypothetical protein RR46_11359 [Papilio xuthus]